MPSVNVDLSVVIERFEGAADKLQAATTAALQQAGLGLEGLIKPVTPFKYGRLRDSIGNEMTGPNTVEVGVIKPQDGKVLIYAPYVEFGTQYIEPRLYVTGTFQREQARITQFLKDKILEAMTA